MRIILMIGVFFTFNAFGADEAFGITYEIFEKWLSGNLGKLVALIGFVLNFVWYVFGVAIVGRAKIDSASFAFPMRGILISLIAGGFVGIANIFFDLGSITFSAL